MGTWHCYYIPAILGGMIQLLEKNDPCGPIRDIYSASQLYTIGEHGRHWVFDEDQKRVTEACQDDKLGNRSPVCKTLVNTLAHIIFHDQAQAISAGIKH